MPRNSKVICIEQSLGLISERGISRRGYKEAPPMQEFLKLMKQISMRYVDHTHADIRESPDLERDARALFETVGPELWPDPDVPRPSWLTDPDKDDLEGRYTKDLVFSRESDNEVLAQLFRRLVVEKTRILHDNEQAKVRKLRQGVTDQVGEDEAMSEVEHEIPEISTPKINRHATRSSHTTPVVASKTDVDKEKHRGFQAINDPTSTRGSINGIDTSAVDDSIDDVCSATEVSPRKESNVASSSPKAEKKPKLSRKRANTAERNSATKRSRTVKANSNIPLTDEDNHPQQAYDDSELRDAVLPESEPQSDGDREGSTFKKPKQPSKRSPRQPSKLVTKILGDLADCPSVRTLIEHQPSVLKKPINISILRMIKDIIVQNPAAKYDKDIFLATLVEYEKTRAPARSKRSTRAKASDVKGRNRNAELESASSPHSPWLDDSADATLVEETEGTNVTVSDLDQTESAHRPGQMSAESDDGILALVEMDWGQDFDFIDTFELPALESVPDFFSLIYRYMPKELMDINRKLLGVNVTPIDAMDRKINVRVSHDPREGRGPLRLLMKRLKRQVAAANGASDLELMFTAVWE